MGSQRVRHDWATKDSTAHSRLTMCDIAHEQQRDSAIRIRVSILPQTPHPPTLPHNINQSSMCYKVGPCGLSILNITVCTGNHKLIL